MPSTFSSVRTITSWCSGRHGAMENPQLPATTVVTPWYDEGFSSGSQKTWASKCVWMSMKPGATAQPDASNSSVPSRSGPISSIDVPGDRHVGEPAGRAGAVEDRPPADHYVSRHGLTPSPT